MIFKGDVMGVDQQQYVRIKAGRKQQGFVLVIVLVMLTVLTLIGVSSMNNSSLELRATANAHQHQIAFNAVQSLLAYAISLKSSSLPVFDFQTTSTTAQTVGYTMTGTSNLSAKAVYAGCSVGVGSSLEQGKGFSYSFYNITGTGSNKTGTATSIQTQGIRYPAAACI